MYDAIERLRPDAVIHLGDHLEDAESMESVFSGVDFYHVPGNCDFFTSAPPSLTISLDGGSVRTSQLILSGAIFRYAA